VSGIAGIFRPGLGPVAAEEISRILEPIRHRGPDDEDSWLGDFAGLGVANFRLTPESEHERQPWVTKRGRVVALDGRLDNRSDILSRLGGSTTALDPAMSDVEVLGASFDAFDDGCLAWTIGDFAGAVVDPQRQTLWLFRDVLGVRPLYYARVRSGIVFASEVKALIAHPEMRVSPNEEMIAEYCIGGWPTSATAPSFFRGVEAVPPSHVVRIDASSIRMRRYWDFDPGHVLRLGSFNEYADAFREEFTRAVDRRLRVQGPVAVSLSGGLDSSSIVGAAARPRAVSGGPEVFGISYATDDNGKADERAYVDAVRLLTGIDVSWVQIKDAGVLADIAAFSWAGEMPVGLSMTQVMLDTWSAVRNGGSRVLLTGHWGDDLVADDTYLVDLLEQGRLLTVLRHLRALPSWTEDADPQVHVREFLSSLTRSVVPHAIKPFARSLRDRLQRTSRAGPWYSPRLKDLARASLTDLQPADPRSGSHHARAMYREARSRTHQVAMCWDNTVALSGGIEMLFPFLDRDLIGFLMSVPGDVLAQDGVHRRILRDGMRPLIPDSVADRRWKGDLTGAWNAAIASELPQISDAILSPGGALDHGLLDPAGVSRLVATTTRESTNATAKWRLIEILGLDQWVRTFFGVPAAG
jgi:asparagine synthase (glutamine-hydrolysing)